MVSHLIRCIGITFWIFKSLQHFTCLYKKSLIECRTLLTIQGVVVVWVVSILLLISSSYFKCFQEECTFLCGPFHGTIYHGYQHKTSCSTLCKSPSILHFFAFFYFHSVVLLSTRTTKSTRSQLFFFSFSLTFDLVSF